MEVIVYISILEYDVSTSLNHPATHSTLIEQSIPFSMALRLRRICSTDEFLSKDLRLPHGPNLAQKPLYLVGTVGLRALRTPHGDSVTEFKIILF